MVGVCRLDECAARCRTTLDRDQYGARVAVPAAETAWRKHHILLHEVGCSLYLKFDRPAFVVGVFVDCIGCGCETIDEIEYETRPRSRHRGYRKRQQANNHASQLAATAPLVFASDSLWFQYPPTSERQGLS